MNKITNFYKFVVIVILLCVLFLLISKIKKETFIDNDYINQGIYMPKKKYDRFNLRANPVDFVISLSKDSREIVLDINKQDIKDFLLNNRKCESSKMVSQICTLAKSDEAQEKKKKKIFDDYSYILKSLENLEKSEKIAHIATILNYIAESPYRKYYKEYGENLGMIFFNVNTFENDNTIVSDTDIDYLSAGSHLYNLEGNYIGQLNTFDGSTSTITISKYTSIPVSNKSTIFAIPNKNNKYKESAFDIGKVIYKYIIRVYVNGKGPYKYEKSFDELQDSENTLKFKYKPEFQAANYRFSISAVNYISLADDPTNRLELESEKIDKEIDYNFTDSIISNTQSLQTDVYCMPDGEHILKKRGGNIKKCQMNFPNINAKDFDIDEFDKYKYISFSDENYNKLMKDMSNSNNLSFNVNLSIQ